MSVCFFVPASDAAGASTSAEDPLDMENKQQQEEAGESTEEKLAQFWTGVMDDIKKSNADHFKAQVLPLARIKKIMKLDEDVKMIASEAPVLFAKACEIFIHELTLRAWSHTCDNKRRTLQRNDIAMAISKSDQFDFLIDIVPRHEVKPPMKREEPPKPAPPAEAPRARPAANEDNNRYYVQLQHQAAQAQPQQIVLQTQPYQMQQQSSATPATSSSSGQQPVTIVQQIVTPSGEVQPVPIQLTAAQLNMIRLQMQSNPSQPIIIQAAAPQPQIIQVTSQAQPQQQQVYVTQVSQESDS